jgi:hypothetical protein
MCERFGIEDTLRSPTPSKVSEPGDTGPEDARPSIDPSLQVASCVSFERLSTASPTRSAISSPPTLLRPDVELTRVEFMKRSCSRDSDQLIWDDDTDDRSVMQWATPASFASGCDLSKADQSYAHTGLVGRGLHKYVRYVSAAQEACSFTP